MIFTTRASKFPFYAQSGKLEHNCRKHSILSAKWPAWWPTRNSDFDAHVWRSVLRKQTFFDALVLGFTTSCDYTLSTVTLKQL